MDLGIWMGIQAAVERRHHNRRRDPDGLAETVRGMGSLTHLPGDETQQVFSESPLVDSGHDNMKVKGHIRPQDEDLVE